MNVATKEQNVSTIPKPSTQKEMVDQLWFAIIGSNGDGLATKIKDTHNEVKDLKAIIPSLMTCEEYAAREAEKEAKAKELAKVHERRKLRPFDKWMLILTAGTMLFIGIESISSVFATKHELPAISQQEPKK